MIKGQEATVITQGPESGHFFRKGQKVTLVKVDKADFFVFMDETGKQIAALEEEDFVFV